MSGILSYVPIANKLVNMGAGSRSANLPPVEVHSMEANPDRRARCLKQLIKANHVNFSILYNNDRLFNRVPHLLSSAYILGASEEQLNELYNSATKELDGWKPSPAEVIDEDWKYFLGSGEYQRAYVDYFEDNLAMEFAYDWKKEMSHFLFEDKEPLYHALIAGVGHPLIHLGYAYEMDSKDIAMESLAIAATQYNFFHKFLDDPSYTRPSPLKDASPLDLLTLMAEDKRFDSLPNQMDYTMFENIITSHESLFMEYWNSWVLVNPAEQFQSSQEAAIALLVATVKPESHGYSLLLAHLLNTNHAVRVLLPIFPHEHRSNLLRQWWLLVLVTFAVLKRPFPNKQNYDDELNGRDWKYLEQKVLNSSWSTDVHFVNVIRTIRQAAETWGDENNEYLLAAATFAGNFQGWKV